MSEARLTVTQLAQDGPDRLRIEWKDGLVRSLAVRDLRLACACALCVEELSGRPLLDPKGIPDDVRPVRIAPVGRYAIQIAWSDGHDTGIYSFERLRELCESAPG
ncbi:MAG: DUF971 domain-containing protein [Myxococcota bacterium]